MSSLRLTTHEVMFIIVILGSLLIGAAVQHYRAKARIHAIEAVAVPTPRPQYVR